MVSDPQTAQTMRIQRGAVHLCLNVRRGISVISEIGSISVYLINMVNIKFLRRIRSDFLTGLSVNKKRNLHAYSENSRNRKYKVACSQRYEWHRESSCFRPGFSFCRKMKQEIPIIILKYRT